VRSINASNGNKKDVAALAQTLASATILIGKLIVAAPASPFGDLP
jgi:hypothetical protein